jgi:hypothetical protein
MATIQDALGSKLIEEWRIPEHLGGDPKRPVYLAGELFDWIDNAMDLHDPAQRKGGRSPFEHLEQSLRDFRCCNGPDYGDIRCVTPQHKGVWSLHCPSGRLLGWIPAPHQFVGIYWVRMSDAHGKGKISEARKKVLQFAKDHGLEETIQPGDFNALFPSKA